MGTPVALRNIVGEAEHRLLVGVVPLDREFHTDIAALIQKMEYGRMQRRLVAIQVLYERADTTNVFEYLAPILTLVVELNAHPGVQERQLT